MRIRLPYTAEKAEARDRVHDLIDLVNSFPMDREAERAHRAEIARLCTRYGLIQELKKEGYNVSLY